MDSAAEHVDVVFHFRAVANRVLLELGGVLGVGRIDVSAVKDAKFDGRVGVAIDLPAERGVAGLGTTLGHRGDGRVLHVDVEDQVREFFSDTDASTREGALVLELVFVEVCHGLGFLDELVFEHGCQIVDRSRPAVAVHTCGAFNRVTLLGADRS